jgi:rubredoxin
MKFKCKICGYIHEGDSAPEQCPKCKQCGVFEPVEEQPASPYAGTQTEKNLRAAFQANPKRAINTPILHPLQKKRGMSRFRRFS